MDAECNRDDRPLQVAGSVNQAPAPVSAVRLSNRCVLLTYFDGDVDSNIDEHFSRSLKAAAARYDVPAQPDDGHISNLLQQQQLYRRTASKYRANSLHCMITIILAQLAGLNSITSQKLSICLCVNPGSVKTVCHQSNANK